MMDSTKCPLSAKSYLKKKKTLQNNEKLVRNLQF